MYGSYAPQHYDVARIISTFYRRSRNVGRNPPRLLIDVLVGVINEDELIYFVRVFIIATEITVEDERPKTDGWFCRNNRHR